MEARAMGAIMSNFGAVLQRAAMEESGNAGGGDGSKGGGEGKSNGDGEEKGQEERARVKNEWRNGGGRGPLSPS
jgi:hypothetical protein